MEADRIRISDEELMARAQADDARAFTELYSRHAAGAFHVASAICREPGTAEEAVQDGFFSIWKSRAEFRPQMGSFKSWSMRIVHNRAVDHYRLLASRPPLQGEHPRPEAADADSDPPFADAMVSGRRSVVLAALGRLPVPQTEVILLSYYGDLSLSEIAIRLEIPAGTVKGRMRLGLEKLRGEPLLVE